MGPSLDSRTHTNLLYTGPKGTRVSNSCLLNPWETLSLFLLDPRALRGFPSSLKLGPEFSPSSWGRRCLPLLVSGPTPSLLLTRSDLKSFSPIPRGDGKSFLGSRDDSDLFPGHRPSVSPQVSALRCPGGAPDPVYPGPREDPECDTPTPGVTPSLLVLTQGGPKFPVGAGRSLRRGEALVRQREGARGSRKGQPKRGPSRGPVPGGSPEGGG